jgi:hypothetical protein
MKNKKNQLIINTLHSLIFHLKTVFTHPLIPRMYSEYGEDNQYEEDGVNSPSNSNAEDTEEQSTDGSVGRDSEGDLSSELDPDLQEIKGK